LFLRAYLREEEGAGDGGVQNEVDFGKNDGENGGVVCEVQLGHVRRLVFAIELTRLGILGKGLGIAVDDSAGGKSW